MKLSFHAMLLATVAFSLPAHAETAAKPVKPEASAAMAATPGKPTETKDYTVIKLDSDEIRNSEVEEVWKGLFPGGSAPDFNNFDENIRQNVLRGLVSERLIHQQAVKAGADKDPEVKKRIDAMARQVVMQSFMEKKAKEVVSDEQLRAAYAEKVAGSKGKEEVKARHILVASEEEARKVADDIKKGTAFEKLAKEKSTDKGSGANGGELGWFTREKMVPAFADAAFKLKKGETSPPVKSDFGWHVIQLEDRRAVQMQTFEEMKESLRGEVAGKAVQEYVEGLLKGADIKYYGADGKEKPFSKSLTPAKPGQPVETDATEAGKADAAKAKPEAH